MLNALETGAPPAAPRTPVAEPLEPPDGAWWILRVSIAPPLPRRRAIATNRLRR